MWNKCAITLFILHISLDFSHLMQIKHLSHKDFSASTDWDFLIFTQHWPATVCKDWTHNKPKHSCAYPKKSNTWTIHGIWPTKIGTRGPENCNNTWLFDPEQVRPIEDELEQTWGNIEKGTPIYELWAHEWNKHGTCAAIIEPLNNEFKYFKKGLELMKQYSMTDILVEAHVLPSDDHPVSVEQISEAIVSKLGKNAMIQCKYEDHIQYLFELRLCLDKQLNLIQCPDHQTGVHKINGVPTNCNLQAEIFYPVQYPPNKNLVQIYKFVNWLQWFTL